MFGFNKPAAAEQPAAVQAEPQRAGRKWTGKMLQRMFNAAKTDRLSESWSATPQTADDVVSKSQRALVARSREQAANNPHMKAFIRLACQNIVGSQGVQLQAQSRDADGTLDTLANQAIEDAFREWGKRSNCDVAGRLSWRALQEACISSAAKDGEFMLLRVNGADAGPWGLSYQLLDPVRCPVEFDNVKLASGRFVRQGIEFSEYGRPVAYYFTTTKLEDADYTYGGNRYKRIPADRIIHGFRAEMAEQKRGLPWASTALPRMKMLDGMDQSTLVNARVSASKGGFFQWRDGYGPEADEDEEIFMEAEPGSFQELPAGVEFKEWNPAYPSGEYASFQKAQLRAASAGLGVLYNNLASDLEGVNFSSIRQGTLDEREHWKGLQEWLIEQLIQPVYDQWLPVALLAGRIVIQNGKPLRADRLGKYRRVKWQPRRWQWIDPRSEVNASVMAKNSGLKSPGDIIREQGGDPDTVWREYAQDIKQMQAAGIDDRFILATLGMPPEPEQGNTTDD